MRTWALWGRERTITLILAILLLVSFLHRAGCYQTVDLLYLFFLDANSAVDGLCADPCCEFTLFQRRHWFVIRSISFYWSLITTFHCAAFTFRPSIQGCLYLFKNRFVFGNFVMVIVNETCEFASVTSAIKLTLILFSDGYSSYLSRKLAGQVSF